MVATRHQLTFLYWSIPQFIQNIRSKDKQVLDILQRYRQYISLLMVCKIHISFPLQGLFQSMKGT